jgi:hypothetical protein
MAGLTVELIADGGIRLTTPDGRTGMATVAAALDWVAAANGDGAPVRLAGAVTAPAASEVAAQVRGAAPRLEERLSTPDAWPHGRSSLQTAAADGHVAALTDLLARGADPNARRGATTPYRLAMHHGQFNAMRVLRDAGARIPRGLGPPPAMPGAVVTRSYAPGYVRWLALVLLAVAAVALVARQWLPAAIIAVVAVALWAAVDLILANTRVAVDGPLVARRRGRGWQGPADLDRLDGLGYAPAANVRTPAMWALAHRGDGRRPNVWTKRAFSDEQLAALDATGPVRIVPLVANRGFLSPGIERYLAANVDRSRVVIGSEAARRIPWPD